MEQKLLSNYRITSDESFYFKPVQKQLVQLVEVFAVIPDCKLQNIAIAEPCVQYDYIFDPFFEREIIQIKKGSNIFVVEQWDKVAVDCIYTTIDDVSSKPFHYRRAILQNNGFDLCQPVKDVQDGSILVIDSYAYNQKGDGGYMEIVLGTNINVKKNIKNARVEYLVRNVAGQGVSTEIESRPEVNTDTESCMIRYNYTTRQEMKKTNYVHSIVDWEIIQRNARCIKITDFRKHYPDQDVEGREFDISFEGSVIGVGFRQQLYEMTLNKQVSGSIKNENKMVRMKCFISDKIWDVFSILLCRFSSRMKAVMKINAENRKKKKINRWLVEILI
jgi:acylphosphatase